MNKFTTKIAFPVIISTNAWKKMADILTKNNKFAFMFFAQSGGCNGFNYKLEPIDKKEFDNFTGTIITDKEGKLLIEPASEMLLLGTTVDFIEEDYNKNIFESRFVFAPQKDLATSCGCGVSFSPKI
jgi:iron-sulfur cluster assembly accessory protein